MKEHLKKLKIDINNYRKTNVLFLTFVITSIINSTILRFFTIRNFLEIKPLLADLALVVIVGAFGYFLKGKKQFIYFFICSIIFSAICIINSMYYTHYLSFASISFLTTSLQVVDVGDAVVKNVIEYKDFIFIWQVVIMLFVHRNLLKKNYYQIVEKIEVRKIRIIHTLVTGLIIIGLFLSTITKLDIGRLTKQWNREYIVMNFGIYTYHLNDLISSVKPKINSIFGYDKNAKEFREYFENKDKEIKTNEYTDIFKGKNIIGIHAESIQNFTLDTSFNGVDVAPNLKKLASEGLYFSNFYAQDGVGTSSDTEFTLASSLLPATNGTVSINYFNREYVTMQKLLKQLGYYTFSVHGNKGLMWNRVNFYKGLGYDHFYYHTKDFEIDEEIGLGLSDKSLFRQSISKLSKISKEHKNYYGTFIMLSNHTPFSYFKDTTDLMVNHVFQTTNPETGEVTEKVDPYMEETVLGTYFKSVHYADQAIGQFINDLDKEGLLENTVVVIYGDHDAKIRKADYNKFYNYDFETGQIKDKTDPTYIDVDFYNYELNRNVPFIIWTKDNQIKKEVNKVMGMYDIAPTLGNMFGFNNEYALGHDIFSIDENIVVFPDGNWLTNKLYYNQQRGEWKQLTDEAVSMEYIEKYNKHADEVMSVSDSIIVYDLIKNIKDSESILKPYK